ncbi:hypothetical protein PLICRDRAFT_35337 [Plicaturopsis crispa FD-325 SS-3]|nr:hypothetical protein PLICRDRAFT_35337 [Plicaturopsis crispa FD-325 SS-3]
MSPATVYLVSGANRGIGFGIVQSLVLRDDVVVFAGARDPAAAKNLQALATEHPAKLHVVKLTSGNEEDNQAAAALVQKVAGHVDVIIANAGIAETWAPVHKAPAEDVRRHFEVNAIGPLVLFQALYPLLQAAPQPPKFVVISSISGSITIGTNSPIEFVALGASKAAVNYITRKIHAENPGFISFALHPGGVATEGAQEAAKAVPTLSKFARITVEESAKGVLERVDEATRENMGGAFLDHTGKVIAW